MGINLGDTTAAPSDPSGLNGGRESESLLSNKSDEDDVSDDISEETDDGSTTINTTMSALPSSPSSLHGENRNHSSSNIGNTTEFTQMDKAKRFFLLYLNEEVFCRGGVEETISYLKYALDNDTPVLLIHEQDALKNGCALECCIAQTPLELVNDPYLLFDNVVVPMYNTDYYRTIGLRQLLVETGAQPTNSMRTWSFAVMKRAIKNYWKSRSDTFRYSGQSA